MKPFTLLTIAVSLATLYMLARLLVGLSATTSSLWRSIHP